MIRSQKASVTYMYMCFVTTLNLYFLAAVDVPFVFFLRCIGSETTWRISPWSGQGCWKEEERSEFCVYSVNICVLFLNSWNTSSPRSSSDVMCALYHYRRRSVNTRHPFQRGLGRRRSREDLRRPTSYRKVHIESLTFHCTM